MRTKELPRRFEGRPVVKAVFLGHAPGREFPYEAFIVTLDEAVSTESAPVYYGHRLKAKATDGRWQAEQTWPAMPRGSADSLFRQFEQGGY